MADMVDYREFSRRRMEFDRSSIGDRVRNTFEEYDHVKMNQMQGTHALPEFLLFTNSPIPFLLPYGLTLVQVSYLPGTPIVQSMSRPPS